MNSPFRAPTGPTNWSTVCPGSNTLRPFLARFLLLINAKWIMSNCVNATGFLFSPSALIVLILCDWQNSITAVSTGPSLWYFELFFKLAARWHHKIVDNQGTDFRRKLFCSNGQRQMIFIRICGGGGMGNFSRKESKR